MLPPPTTASSEGSSKRYLWSLAFYAQFFDVDTSTVLHRCLSAIYPRANFLDVLEGNPDLYGPFWIATTVVVILFLTGTISQYLSNRGEEHFAYDFKLLSGRRPYLARVEWMRTGADASITGAAGLIYGYTGREPCQEAKETCADLTLGVIPIALWGILKWFGSESANLLECWALYGYANIIWIPVALISWSLITSEILNIMAAWSLAKKRLTVLNWVFVGVGFAVSALFLFRNLYLHPDRLAKTRV